MSNVTNIENASAAKTKGASKPAPKKINLALQGGGAHGAYTWGVLDRLLEDGRLEIEAISGTSAGAMNAVVAADGMMQNGREGARQALQKFWKAVSVAGEASPIKRSPVDVFMGNWSLDTSPAYLMMDILNRVASPYELNPLNINPLKELVEAHVDFDLVRSCEMLKVFVSATNVETGRVKVFNRKQLTADMVMASACLPFMFQAIEIDGIPYWDGGYVGNPVLFPFFNNCGSRDVVLVQINPLIRKGTPKTARDILNRVNEISFNSSLISEFRAINFVSRLIDKGQLSKDDYRQVLLHTITADADLKPLSASSKLNAEWVFLLHLFEIGRAAADRWLVSHFEAVGCQATVDVEQILKN